MRDLNSLFFKRIGILKGEKVTFEKLESILEKAAKAIPFENLSVISNQVNDITKNHLIDKILLKNEGGLCYELNALLYFFLIENGFNVNLYRGAVYNHSMQDWAPVGRTHVTMLLIYDAHTYLIDTGFGANLPLRPVPLNGEIVSSSNGDFRIKKMINVHGNYVLELKLKHKDNDLKIGYTFDSNRPIKDISELNKVQRMIVENPKSPFNKKPLITQVTDRGNHTLTNTSFTQWVDGKITKEKIDQKEFNRLVNQHFGMNLLRKINCVM